MIGYKGDAWYEIVHIVLLDYVPFIVLLTALFTAAGGICLKGSLRGSPAVNTIIIAIGTALAMVEVRESVPLRDNIISIPNIYLAY